MLEKVSKEILNWPGVTIDQHRFGGTEFRIGKREMGHIHGDRLDDLPCFHVEDWYSLVGKLPSIQLIVMPQAGHAVQHQYPELPAKYITEFIENSH